MATTRTIFKVVLLFCIVLNLGSLISARGRVVGGVNAPNQAAPYIVSIQQNGVHYCAGSILTANWVVTAAHCLGTSSQVLASELVAGSNNVAGTATTTQRVSIDKYIVNDLYTGGATPYDIGLIYSSAGFQWTSAVAAISLPVSNSIPSGSAILFGWGSTSTTQTAAYPTQLQMATVPIITSSSCEQALGAKGVDVHDTNICTGPLTGGISICSADSGGPLVQVNSSGETILVGIVSWGKTPCGQVNSPSVYVNIGSFITWISTNESS